MVDVYMSQQHRLNAIQWKFDFQIRMTLGVVAYRRSQTPAKHRLAGAGAISLGSLALVLAAVRYALTLEAISRLENLI